MNSKLLIRSLLITSLLLLLNSLVYALNPEKIITWYIFDLKPTHFITGAEKGRGYADYVQARLIENMKDYEHDVQIVSVARLVADLEAGKPFCTINGFYGGAPFPTAYSAPFNITGAREIIYLKKNRAKIFGRESSVSFESLIKNKKLIFGHMAGEPYHPKINQLFKENQSPAHVFIRYDSTRMAEGLFQMLLKERIDYFLTLREVYNYHKHQMKVEEELGSELPIETKTFTELVAPNCTGNDWGRVVVKDISKILVKIRPTPEFRKVLEKWFATPENKKEYKHLYEKQVLSRNEYRLDLELK